MLIATENITLREYLFLNNISISQFAKKIDCNRDYMSRIVRKKIKPGIRLAMDIEKETEGLVKVEELIK